MRLVLDTNVVLSGLLWRSHPRHLLDLAKVETLSLYTSSVLLDELATVLAREKWATMLATRHTDAAYLMQRYGVLATVVRPKPIGRVVPDDPDDDAIIACALAARADLIVSGANTCTAWVDSTTASSSLPPLRPSRRSSGKQSVAQDVHGGGWRLLKRFPSPQTSSPRKRGPILTQ